MKKNPAIALCAVLIFISTVVFAQPSPSLSAKSLNNDISYYKKTSEQQNLNPNDRYYILLKIQNKYRDSGIDLAVLNTEISKVKPPEEKKPAEKTETKISTQTADVSPDAAAAEVPSPAAQPAAPPAPAPTKNLIPADKPKSESQSAETLNYKVETGDILSINISPAKELSQELVVKADGTITMPLIGMMKAQGKTIGELKDTIQRGLSIYVTRPKVEISMKSFNNRQVFIMGEISKPGAYEYKEKYRLFDLITTAGGLTQSAGTKAVSIHRGEGQERKTLSVNLEEIMKSGDFSKDFILQPGDIVEIPKEPKKVSVIGEVHSPGSYDWRENLFVLDLVSQAGGPTDISKLNSVKIFRGNEAERETLEINLQKIMDGNMQIDEKLQPGDIVYIPRKGIASNQWFVNSVMPWLSLVAMVLVIMTYSAK